MYIRRIGLKNYRGFDQFSLDFHPNVTLLVGENGAGKTALLDALALVLSEVLPLVGFRLDSKTADIRQVLRMVGGQREIEPQLPMEISGQVDLGEGKELQYTYSTATNQAKLDGNRAIVPEAGRGISAVLPLALPLAVYFQADRRWEREIKIEREWHGDRSTAYSFWNNPSFNQSSLLTWLRDMTFVELQESAPVAQLQSIRQAIRDAVPGVTDLEYTIRHKQLWLHLEGGRTVAYEQLSGGYRNLLAVVADIAWRAAVLNPHLMERSARETPGVVLIDELELHLHPRWQRQVLPMLRRAFPLLQLVAATHSPQVLAGARREWVRLLEHGQEARQPDFVEGRDTNSLLEDVFAVSSRPQESLAEVRELSGHIDREEYEEARQLLARLEQKLGPDDPDLIRARWFLDMENE